jgi:hypothetical protein
VHEAQLVQCLRAQREWVRVVLPQAAIEAVEQEGQGNPLVHQLVEVRRLPFEGVGHLLGLIGIVTRHHQAGVVRRSGFEQVHHVQVVGPGFGPVFPGMGGGVGADVVLLPAAGRATRGVVSIQRLGVVDGLVAEFLAERLQAPRILDQGIPVVVAGFVPQMSQQRAVGFMQGHAAPHPLGVVGFGDVQRDHALAVACHDLLAGQVRQELKRGAVALAGRRVRRRQAQLGQGVEQPPLGNLDAVPAFLVLGHGKVGQ